MQNKLSDTLGTFFRHFTQGTLTVFAVILIVSFCAGHVYFVSEQQQAVVTNFGQFAGLKSAGGPYIRIPFMQKVQKVDTTTHGMPIGYTSPDESDYAQSITNEAEALMITSDFNFVDVDFYLEYKVSDPVKYLYHSDAPEAILKNLAQASIRQTVSRYTVDEAITTGKSQIQAEVKSTLTHMLEQADVGLQVVNLSIQDSEPPTASVIAAFKAVENAKQGADTALNNANQYKNEKLPAAEAEADRIIQEAEAYKTARIAEAEGQVQRFEKTYAEYADYPLITKQRMFYEAMGDILPSLKVIITDGGTQTMLPLESFAQTAAQN